MPSNRSSNTAQLRGSALSDSGFTVVELLVAIVIISIAASALALLANTTTTGNYRSKDEAAAAALAIDKLEQVKATPFANVGTTCVNDAGTLTENGGSGGIFTRTCSYTATTINGVSAYDVTVSVTWTNGGAVTLTTKVANVPQLTTGVPTVYIRSWNQVN